MIKETTDIRENSWKMKNDLKQDNEKVEMMRRNPIGVT